MTKIILSSPSKQKVFSTYTECAKWLGCTTQYLHRKVLNGEPIPTSDGTWWADELFCEEEK